VAVGADERRARAQEYRARAAEILADAEACGLENVRRKLEKSAAVWITLAEAAEESRTRLPPRH
jgi:hypothetical protein